MAEIQKIPGQKTYLPPPPPTPNHHPPLLKIKWSVPNLFEASNKWMKTACIILDKFVVLENKDRVVFLFLHKVISGVYIVKSPLRLFLYLLTRYVFIEKYEKNVL